MSDDDIRGWVVPAITLGYAVQNDTRGKFRFFTESVEIVYRGNAWLGRDLPCCDSPDADRIYNDLQTALTTEAKWISE